MTMEVIQRDLLFSYVEESKGFVLPCSIPCLSHDRRGISEKCKTQKGVKNARISLPCLLKSIRTDKVAEPFSERHYSYDCRALHSSVTLVTVKGWRFDALLNISVFFL